MGNKLAIFLILIFVGSPVYAQETVYSEPGIKPGSLFYGLDKALERLELYFTEGHSNKARVHLKHSQERLAEALELSAEGDVSGAEEALEGYDEAIDDASLEVMIAEMEGKDVSDLFDDVIKSYERQSEVLKNVIENSPVSDQNRISEKFDLTDILEKAKVRATPFNSIDVFSTESGQILDVSGPDVVSTPEEVETPITTDDLEKISSPEDLESIEVIVTEAEGETEAFDDAVEEIDDGIQSETDTAHIEVTDGSSTVDTSEGSTTGDGDSQVGDSSSSDTSGGSTTGIGDSQGGDSQGGDTSSSDTSGGTSTGSGGSSSKGKGGKGGGDSQGGDSQGEDEQ